MKCQRSSGPDYLTPPAARLWSKFKLWYALTPRLPHIVETSHCISRQEKKEERLISLDAAVEKAATRLYEQLPVRFLQLVSPDALYHALLSDQMLMAEGVPEEDPSEYRQDARSCESIGYISLYADVERMPPDHYHPAEIPAPAFDSDDSDLDGPTFEFDIDEPEFVVDEIGSPSFDGSIDEPNFKLDKEYGMMEE